MIAMANNGTIVADVFISSLMTKVDTRAAAMLAVNKMIRRSAQFQRARRLM
jgi:hypothetical protein